jgi:hypothetical protein
MNTDLATFHRTAYNNVKQKKKTITATLLLNIILFFLAPVEDTDIHHNFHNIWWRTFTKQFFHLHRCVSSDESESAPHTPPTD